MENILEYDPRAARKGRWSRVRVTLPHETPNGPVDPDEDGIFLRIQSKSIEYRKPGVVITNTESGGAQEMDREGGFEAAGGTIDLLLMRGETAPIQPGSFALVDDFVGDGDEFFRFWAYFGNASPQNDEVQSELPLIWQLTIESSTPIMGPIPFNGNGNGNGNGAGMTAMPMTGQARQPRQTAAPEKEKESINS